MAQKIQIHQDVLFQPVAEEAVLLHLGNGGYFGLDDVGMRMWQVLTETGSVDAAVAQLVAEYEVDEATLRRDLDGLIGELEQAGLIVRVDG